MKEKDPFQNELTGNEFNLECKIICKKLPYIDEQSDGRKVNREGIFAFLIPSESTEMMRFFNAWLPYSQDEHTEVALELGYPLACNARGAVMRANHRCNKHHIQLMSYGIIQLIETMPSLQNRNISVKALPDYLDEMADKTGFDGELPFKKKEYNDDASELSTG